MRLIFLASCVPNRNVLFLQKNDVNKKNLPKDTILRTYAIDTFQYKIQPNDIVSIRFESLTPKELDFFSQNNTVGGTNVGLGNALLIGELVDEKGEVPFPVVGKVKVSELTVFEVQEKLQKLANAYIESPTVKVRLLNYRITLLGEVNKEGVILLTNNRASMLEAIGLAGGLTDLADRRDIKLIRQVGGRTEVQYINLLDENFMRSPYYYVYQNDILIVPPLRQRTFRKYFGENFSIILSSVSILLLTITLLKK